MPRPVPSTFARFVTVPENRSAFMAVQDTVATLGARDSRRFDLPLYLHGPAGTGKTCLVAALVEEALRHWPTLTAAVLSASDWKGHPPGSEGEGHLSDQARGCDLLVVEDLQHLPPSACRALAGVLDHRLARQSAMVVTATAGPQVLRLPARLASRLAGGLVVALEALGPASRLALLQDKAQRRQLAVGREVLAWLAQHLTGSRQLEGALASLEVLARVSGRVPDVPLVAAHFREQAEASRPTVERIAQKVGDHFHVEPRRLRSEQRGRHVLVPRQVGMYLARQLTGLSLAQIGDYFGGRDHTTVLHACRKVERALSTDSVLSGTVRQLHATFV